MEKSVVVIGDGWAALGAVGFLAAKGAGVHWVTATGARIAAPLPTLETGFELHGLQAWSGLAQSLGIDCGAAQTGSFLREFKNKSFREPAWTKAPTPEARVSVIEETLWEGERCLAPIYEGRYTLTVNELEALIRERLTSENYPSLTRIEEVPVISAKFEGGAIDSVLLGNGQEISCSEVIYADRWSAVSSIQNFPKSMKLLRKREPIGVLQAIFAHEMPMGAGVLEGFYGSLHREAGEENDKHVWGHFSSDGKKSCWTTCLTQEEGEDNHLIAKKLRRMKSALDKMFTGEAWIPQGKADFMATVSSEQVRFEEGALYNGGEMLIEPVSFAEAGKVLFLTDGCGPSSALHQAARAAGFSLELNTGLITEPRLEHGAESEAETPDVDEAGIA